MGETATVLREEHIEFKKPNQLKEIWRRLKKDKLAMFGLIVILLIIVMAVCANFAADYEAVIKLNTKIRLQPPPLPSICSAPTATAATSSPAVSTAPGCHWQSAFSARCSPPSAAA